MVSSPDSTAVAGRGHLRSPWVSQPLGLLLLEDTQGNAMSLPLAWILLLCLSNLQHSQVCLLPSVFLPYKNLILNHREKMGASPWTCMFMNIHGLSVFRYNKNQMSLWTPKGQYRDRHHLLDHCRHRVEERPRELRLKEMEILPVQRGCRKWKTQTHLFLKSLF